MKKETNKDIQRRFQRKRKFEAIEHYGGKCVCCGEDRVKMLMIVKKKGKLPANQIYNWLRERNYPKGYHVKCCNCEYAHRVYDECPHQAEKNMDEGNKTIAYNLEKARIFNLYWGK